MKEILTKISIPTLFFAHLFLCGTIYLISYWTTFNFDITNFIELLDIPKSFIFPMVSAFGISLFIFFIQALLHTIKKVEKDEKINEELLPKLKELPTKTILRRIFLDYNTIFFIILFVCIAFYKPQREWVYALGSLTMMLYGIIKFIRHPFLIGVLPNFGTRIFIGTFVVIFPIFSFMTGKLNSIKVYKNLNYYKISEIEFVESTIKNRKFISAKLLGKLGTTLFLSDSSNSKITTLSLEKISSIEFKYVGK